MDRDEPRSCARLQLEAQLVGRSLVGERVFDAMRWIDYAVARPDIDARRPLVVGHSTGGTVALFTAALDERVQVVFVSGYLGLLMEMLTAIDHCECNYVSGLALLGDLPEVAALVAPRRLRFSHGRQDRAFPLQGAETAFARAQSMFTHVGGTVDLRIGDAGHIVYPEHLWELLAEAGSPAAADP